MLLTKSDFLLYLKHPAWLWLKIHDSTKLPKVDAALQRIFDRGHRFESYAESQFAEGVRLGFDGYAAYATLPERTRVELDGGAQTLFQGRFQTDQLTCIVDILHRVDNERFDLIEVKSSSSVKKEHIPDLAFQTLVLERCGLHVRSMVVMHANRDYVREGAVEPGLLVGQTEVTDEVRALMPEVEIRISEALSVAAQSAMPDPSPAFAHPSALKDWLEIYARLVPQLPKNSIYSLAGRSVDQLEKLEALGIELMAHIPDDFELTTRQRWQVKAVKAGQPLIDRERIAEFVESIRYPVYFLDYETVGDIVPPFDGMRPYQQTPFQFSLHRLNTLESEPVAEAFLHQDASYPAPDFVRALKRAVGSSGTVLVWNEAFETKINSQLAQENPDWTEFFEWLNERIVDLMAPFARFWWVDSRFGGSASIKKVQPILAGELAYADLPVAKGDDAQRLWMETFLEGKHEPEKEHVVRNLLEYCRYDTAVMVAIWKKLSKVAHG